MLFEVFVFFTCAQVAKNLLFNLSVKLSFLEKICKFAYTHVTMFRCPYIHICIFINIFFFSAIILSFFRFRLLYCIHPLLPFYHLSSSLYFHVSRNIPCDRSLRAVRNNQKERKTKNRSYHDIARPNTISLPFCGKLSFRRTYRINENFISFCSINFLFLLLLVLPIRCTVSFPGNEWTRRSRHVLPFIEHAFPRTFFPACVSFFFSSSSFFLFFLCLFFLFFLFPFLEKKNFFYYNWHFVILFSLFFFFFFFKIRLSYLVTLLSLDTSPCEGERRSSDVFVSFFRLSIYLFFSKRKFEKFRLSPNVESVAPISHDNILQPIEIISTRGRHYSRHRLYYT